MDAERKDSKRQTKFALNDYLNDRLSAQRLLSCISLMIPLGLFCLYLITPHTSDSGSEIILMGISATVILLNAIRLIRNWNTPRGDTYQLYSALLDFLSAAAILIGYALAYHVPISIALKSPTANIFFIYLTARIVLFNGKMIALTGAMAVGTWTALTLISIYEPGSFGRTSSYIEYLTGFEVLVGAEIERMIQFGIISLMLYLYIFLARHDAQTGFLRRAYFFESLLKFLSQSQNKFSNNSYALIEFRATELTHSNKDYNFLFNGLPQVKTFQNTSFKKFGRLSPQSALAWIEFKGDNHELANYLKQLHKELSELAASSLGSKTPTFIIGGTLLELNTKDESQLSRPSIAIQDALMSGEKTMVFDQDLETKILAKQSVEQAIKQGLTKNMLFVAYQPIIDLMTNRPVGLEALIRLNTETGGSIGPDVFIPVAEESGLIDHITEYLCERIAHEAVDIRNMYFGSGIDPYININISPIQLKDINRITTALNRASASGLRINAEITESTILNEDKADDQIQSLISAGFNVAIDDFGTGYSSIQRLKKLNNMVLKIDQSFVRDIENSEAYSFLGAIVNLAQVTSSSVIIEGVENLQQQLLLMKLGVRFCQGFLYAKPMPVNELKNYLIDQYDIVPPTQRRAGRIATF